MGKVEDKLDYLEIERQKIWSEILRLKKEIDIRPSDYENEAKQSSKKASEFRNKCESSYNTASEYLNDLINKYNDISAKHASYEGIYNNIVERHNYSVNVAESLASKLNTAEERINNVEECIGELEVLYNNITTYSEHVAKLEELVQNITEYTNKTESLYKSILVKKNEIDQLHINIIGFTEEDKDTGEKTYVPGLKKQLEDSFESSSESLKSIKKELNDIKLFYQSMYDQYIKEKKSELDELMKSWEQGYKEIHSRVGDLLPNALTKGLSQAYSEKKSAEEIESKKLNTTFKWAIGGMISVSLIPLSFSLWSLATDREVKDILIDSLRLVASILPLYVPVLWVAYSANKKNNLTKRLIEEYTHKEVISKTYEGLSTQINNIADNEVKSDLRTRLLYNILEVNSENPGKLISDYNKADHPLMDALDKSVKLAEAVEKLKDIPGFKKLSDTIDKKSKKIVTEKAKKANAGLELIDDDVDDNDDDEKTMENNDTSSLKSSK